jgi:hypothetical protein
MSGSDAKLCGGLTPGLIEHSPFLLSQQIDAQDSTGVIGREQNIGFGGKGPTDDGAIIRVEDHGAWGELSALVAEHHERVLVPA